MKRFTFTLERILDWRKLQEEAERGRLEALLAEERRILHEITATGKERDDAEAAALARVDVIQLGALDRYREFLVRRRLKLEGECKDAGASINAQRARLVESRRHVELLQRLKGKALDKWRVQFNRELEEQAAESALAGWRRVRSSSV